MIPSKTVVVLLQNGLNIEKPFFEEFPSNIVLSGVSYTGCEESSRGVIEQSHHDILTIGAFHNPKLDRAAEQAAAHDFIFRYSAGGRTNCTYVDNVEHSRWKKLIYNASLNPISAILRTTAGVMRQSGVTEALARPVMGEIVAVAAAKGYHFPSTIIEETIERDPVDSQFRPSMCVDISKVSSDSGASTALFWIWTPSTKRRFSGEFHRVRSHHW